MENNVQGVITSVILSLVVGCNIGRAYQLNKSSDVRSENEHLKKEIQLLEDRNNKQFKTDSVICPWVQRVK